MKSRYNSWGNTFTPSQKIYKPYWRDMPLPLDTPLLPYGQGKSYGDVCLNNNGTIISTEHLRRFISFDKEKGILACESGVTLAEILELIVPAGWFLEVTPGTKYISVGGAIGNDVHGKNHTRAGTFAHYVKRFELRRSDNTTLICSPTENTDLFAATIGGLGLTGLITWAEFSLKAITSTDIHAETIKTTSLKETIHLLLESQKDFEYSIASLDSAAPKNQLGRSHVILGNHSTKKDNDLARTTPKRPILDVPFKAPSGLLNPFTIKTFSNLYYNRIRAKKIRQTVHYDPYFYPQDTILNWNRFYGKRGFLQHQCQLPLKTAPAALEEMLKTVSDSDLASPLTTLKVLGNKPSLGLLSFPREGFTLALDFPNTGQKTLELFNRLDAIVEKAQGSMYLAKDARLSKEHFRMFYPDWETFKSFVDPNFSSDFWKRINS